MHGAFRTTNLFVAVAVLVVVGSALFADRQNSTLQEQQLRSEVTRQVSVIRTRLEGNINGNLQLVRGLVATLVDRTRHGPDALRPAREPGSDAENRSCATSPAHQISRSP